MIFIKGCANCPHGSLWSLEGSYMCAQLGKENKKPLEPLENCPLDDAMEKIKAIFKK